MDYSDLISSLRRFPDILKPAVEQLSDEDARWKPADGAWSILEVIAHLADEEADDFRTRVRMTLADPGQPWPPIDPEGWARDRNYNQRDPAGELSRFLQERNSSLEWLDSLSNPDWNLPYEHPRIGPIRAGDVFVSWAAHDLLHLRQITKRRFQLAQVRGGEFRTWYAGDWPD